MTDMMDRMEREGIAERFRDPENRRLVKVRLTDKGKRIRREFYEKRRAEFTSLFSQLGDTEIREYVQHLKAASNILKKIK